MSSGQRRSSSRQRITLSALANRLSVLTFSLLLTIASWETRADGEPKKYAPHEVKEGHSARLRFDQDRAFKDLAQLVERGQRYYAAPMRAEAISWMAERLRSAGGVVSEQKFTAVEPKSQVKYSLTNVIARFHPEREQRVMIGSHFDTRLWAEEDHDHNRRGAPITGANDGSSGVAVLFEIGRQLSDLSLRNVGVDLVLFDGEDGRPGSSDYCVGSKYFAAQLSDYYPKRAPRAVFVIDMVGDKQLSFPPELSSIKKSRALTQLLWREGVRLKLPAFISGLGGRDGQSMRPRSRWIIDDHSPFHELNIPATLLIDLDYPHWHTHQDTLDKVSPHSLMQAGLALLASLIKLDEIYGGLNLR